MFSIITDTFSSIHLTSNYEKYYSYCSYPVALQYSAPAEQPVTPQFESLTVLTVQLTF